LELPTEKRGEEVEGCGGGSSLSSSVLKEAVNIPNIHLGTSTINLNLKLLNRDGRRISIPFVHYFSQ
jgi:hypothetical protein